MDAKLLCFFRCGRRRLLSAILKLIAETYQKKSAQICSKSFFLSYYFYETILHTDWPVTFAWRNK